MLIIILVLSSLNIYVGWNVFVSIDILFFCNGEDDILDAVNFLNMNTPSDIIALPYFGKLNQKYNTDCWWVIWWMYEKRYFLLVEKISILTLSPVLIK